MKPIALTAALAVSLALAACGNEVGEVAEVTTPVLNTPVDDTAQAINTTPDRPGVAPAWDIDRDGMMQENEFAAVTDRGISAWDRDANGNLDKQEFQTGWRQTGLNAGDKAFAELDRNADGNLLGNEFPDRDDWNLWDKNDSGIVERGETEFL